MTDDEAATGEVGEIAGTSPLLMAGYYNRPDLTAAAVVDGWLFTGDMGFVDAEGFLHLVDRQKDLIISGSINVYPRDIEEVIVVAPGRQGSGGIRRSRRAVGRSADGRRDPARRRRRDERRAQGAGSTIGSGRSISASPRS